jgi:DegV family protein with EDD domain
MSRVEVFVDSSSGLQYGDHDPHLHIVSNALNWDLKTGPVSHLETSLDDQKFHELSQNCLPRTAGVQIEFYNQFMQALRNGKDIFGLTVSGAESGVFNFAIKASEAALSEVGLGKSGIIFDSRMTSLPMAWMAEYAVMWAEKDYDLNTINNELVLRRPKFGIYAFISDQGLDSLQHNGRAKEVVAASLFKALHLKPVLAFNQLGKLYLIGKGNTAKNTIRYMISNVLEINGLTRLGVVHTGDPNLAGQVIDDLRAGVKGSKITVENRGFAGYTLQAQAGTGSIGIGFEAK